MNIFSKLISILRVNYGVISLIFLVIIVGIINFKPGTILTGWDNLHPEFDLSLNIKRSFFAVWQEYQGLGLLGGMGHASDLVRQVFLGFLNVLIPQNYLRYFWMILSLLIGGIGTYIFIKTFLVPYQNSKKELYSLLGGFFYTLNLATIQTYYVAFEAFTSHFAFLPWMFWAFLLYVKNANKRNLIIMFVVFLVSTPSSYIPTLFVAFLMALTLVVSALLLTVKDKAETLLSVLKAYGILFLVNAFWLLPFLYFTLTNSQVNLNAKMNQMATHTIFSQNKEFGNIEDVALLKGFWFNNVDPDITGNFRFMLQPWKEHLNNPLVVACAIAIFLIVLLGAFNVVQKRRPLHLAILLLFIFTFTMLTTNTPPFSWIVGLFREVPLFGQAFRFPFTKFSILAAFSYSLLFVLGVELLIGIKKRFLSKTKTIFIPLIAIILIAVVSLPVFKGNLFYEKEQIELPNEYAQVFDFFKKADQNTRIANFPQHTFWGWNFYSWGYGGSGFLWYGIKQPILDRAFDVWSSTLENYYYEASYALYSKDPELFEKILNKYQINYILVDENVIAPQSPKSLFFSETKNLISQLQSVKKVAQFGNIAIYEVELKDKPQNFLFSTQILPSANGYNWSELDTNYEKLGNYQTEANEIRQFTPFVSLFSKKQTNTNYGIKLNENSIEFSQKLPKITQAKLTIPSLLDDKVLPIEIENKLDASGNAIISVHILTPTVSIGNAPINNSEPLYYPLFVVPQAEGKYTLNINGVQKINFDIQKEQKFLGYVFLQNDTFVSLQKEGVEEVLSQKIDKGYINSLESLQENSFDVRNIAKDTILKVSLPYGNDNFYSYNISGSNFTVDPNCNVFRTGKVDSRVSKNSLVINTKNDSMCTSKLVETLPHDIGYLTIVRAKNLKGDPLHFWILNNNNGYALIDTELSRKDDTSLFVIPPMETHGLSYSLHADNISIGNDESENRIDSVEILPISYKFLTNMVFASEQESKGGPILFSATHPNESLYIIAVQDTGIQDSTIVLSQSYDRGWKAYDINYKFDIFDFKLWQAFPFIFGKEVKSHIKVNNWANGWELDRSIITKPNNQIVIVYLPQYLQYLGLFGVLTFTIYLFLGKTYGKIDAFFDIHANRLKRKVKLHKNS